MKMIKTQVLWWETTRKCQKKVIESIKGILMQIWKSPYMFLFIFKKIPWKFCVPNFKNSRVIYS